VFEFDEKGVDVVQPFIICTRKFIPSHVVLDFMVIFDEVGEVIEVFNSNTSDPKVIQDVRQN
jgi:hypothetical protein